jgi:hypothetical protein
VLGKISTLPMPNFITFDEVLCLRQSITVGNLVLKDMYDIVFLITHNDLQRSNENAKAFQ